ncbi:MarR family winged helix-turn-helix transcriptional regulator [Nocardioides mesophilus]|uniref:MarR family transcriptional regulator n=1 Tax=Nocardioides mesophilus TaxID=433659 RepID=A0A7G9R7R9_9ACTN|nr:MarR family transcriptional regulator [Nocardioides mesophilus]QNN51644.1 MarR family transcriptional regulator [Nocardioides mesophilus]
MQPTASEAVAGSTPEPATVEDAVMLALVRVGQRLRQRLPGEDLEFTSIPLLKALQHRGPLRVSTLAEHLHLDASTVSRHVRSLEDRGMLERATDPDDGRASRVAISALGLSRVEAGSARRRALLGEAIAAWDDTDRETLRRLLYRLASDIQELP